MFWLFHVMYPVIIVAAWTVIVKMFPALIGKSIENYIQHKLDKRLEAFKAEVQASYSTVMKSADLLPSLRSEIASKSIESVENIWANVISLGHEYGDLVLLDDLYHPKEIDVEIKSQKTPSIRDILDKYREGQLFNKKIVDFAKLTRDKNRLFVSDRLWVAYLTIYRFYGRLALLMNWSIKKNSYNHWKEDSRFISMMRRILPEEVIHDAMNKETGGLRHLLTYLDEEILQEARKVISGSDSLSDSFSDIQAILTSAIADIIDQRVQRGMEI